MVQWYEADHELGSYRPTLQKFEQSYGAKDQSWSVCFKKLRVDGQVSAAAAGLIKATWPARKPPGQCPPL